MIDLIKGLVTGEVGLAVLILGGALFFGVRKILKAIKGTVFESELGELIDAAYKAYKAGMPLKEAKKVAKEGIDTVKALTDFVKNR